MAVEPNVKDKSITKKPSYDKVEFLRKVRLRCGRDEEDRTEWKNKMVIAHYQRMGVKRYSNFPYAGAPDVPLPETDKVIKKAVPTLVLSSMGQKKICTVKVENGAEETPERREKARKAEKGMNFVLLHKDQDWFRKQMLAADNGKQFGHALFKVREQFSTYRRSETLDIEEKELLVPLRSMSKEMLAAWLSEKYELDLEDKDEKKIIDDIIKRIHTGEKIIDFEVPKVKSFPIIDVPIPSTVTVPAHTTDINYAERIREEFYLSAHQLDALMRDEIFKEKDIEDIPKAKAKEDLLSVSMSRSEGITDNTITEDLYRMETISCWHKESENAPYLRKLFTFFADVTDPEEALVQELDFPFTFDGWNWEKWDNEIRDTRYYTSRGVPEMVRAMQEIMERSINNMIIRDEMLNTPIWEVLSTSEIMDISVHLTPGQKLPVQQLGGEIKQLNTFPKADTASQQILTILKAYTEEYLAVSDQLFRNATNVGGGKTLGEIQLGIQQNAGPMSMEVASWNETLSRVYTKVFYILKERLGESLYIDGEEITREDFDFPAEVRSNGNLEVSNQQLAAQKAFARVNVLLNPNLADIVNSEDRYNSLRDWLEKDGVKDPDQFCTDPTVIAKQQIAQLQQQLQQLQQQAMALQNQAQEQVKKTEKAKLQEQDTRAKIKATLEKGQEDVLTAGAGRTF